MLHNVYRHCRNVILLIIGNTHNIFTIQPTIDYIGIKGGLDTLYAHNVV